jgi:hypothetical protein
MKPMPIKNNFLNNKLEIINWLEKMNIKNYTINQDLTVDVDGNVDLIKQKLKTIPVQFGEINGNFYCWYNDLTSLEGCPHTVKGSFFCNFNKLDNLKGGPKYVLDEYNCSCSTLKSLEGCALEVGTLNFRKNKLVSMIGISPIIHKRLSIIQNDINDLSPLLTITTNPTIILHINDPYRVQDTSKIPERYIDNWRIVATMPLEELLLLIPEFQFTFKVKQEKETLEKSVMKNNLVETKKIKL